MQQVVRSDLSKMRISANLPRSLIFASLRRWFRSPQSVWPSRKKHIKLAVVFLRSSTFSVQLLNCSFEEVLIRIVSDTDNAGLDAKKMGQDWILLVENNMAIRFWEPTDNISWNKIQKTMLKRCYSHRYFYQIFYQSKEDVPLAKM